MSEGRRSFWQFWKRAPEPAPEPVAVAAPPAISAGVATLERPAPAAADRVDLGRAEPAREPAAEPGPTPPPSPPDHAEPGDTTPSEGTPPHNAPPSDEPDAYVPPKPSAAVPPPASGFSPAAVFAAPAAGAAPPAPVRAEDAAPAQKPAADEGGWFARLRKGLGRSSNNLGERVSSLFTKQKLDAAQLQALEDILIEADLGLDTAVAITDRLSENRFARGIEPRELQAVLAEEVERVLAPYALPLAIEAKRPFVVLVVGVNGTGKTTTIGKIAAQQARAGRRLVLVAGDTFRAAAVEQLKFWGERSGARVVSGAPKADAAGLVFEAIDAAKDADVLVIDTAGRLQNKAELMAELEKIVRIIKRRIPDAPHAVLLTLDATTGQNALNQVDIFREKVGVTGLVMTKLDGTARGGILVAIARKHKLPIHFVGVGEGIDDLAPFEAKEFARAIAGL